MAHKFNDAYFELWMREVDAALLIICGQVASDIDDAPYRDMFADRVSAKAAARRAVRLSKEACGM